MMTLLFNTIYMKSHFQTLPYIQMGDISACHTKLALSFVSFTVLVFQGD